MKTRIIYDDQDELFRISSRPNRCIFRKDLRDGNKYTLEFYRVRVHTPGHPIIYRWYVSLYVGDFRKANSWRRTFKSKEITGSGSIRCLRSAAAQVRWFITHLDKNEELAIQGTDERRARVYDRLLKYPEFIEQDGMIIARNPNIWTWERR
ncbi:hypothetical protein [Paenibacillus wulumuqiensis]|uniref:hypothetical protein n=1 Tax=Paenibacillus wulumuqiensis TaxID=1567107 RepID=UPI0006192FD5|nr:hypothetical protein [Paenibacillus wulumuqiensis]